MPLPGKGSVEDLLGKFWEDLGNFEKTSDRKMKRLASTMVQNKFSGKPINALVRKAGPAMQTVGKPFLYQYGYVSNLQVCSSIVQSICALSQRICFPSLQ